MSLSLSSSSSSQERSRIEGAGHVCLGVAAVGDGAPEAGAPEAGVERVAERQRAEQNLDERIGPLGAVAGPGAGSSSLDGVVGALEQRGETEQPVDQPGVARQASRS